MHLFFLKVIIRDFKRPNHFQRLDQQPQPSMMVERPSHLLKDLAKISQFNLSRLSQYCSYSMFSNESTESLNTASSTASPCSVRLAKSHSSHTNLENINLDQITLGEDVNETGRLPKDIVSVPNFAAEIKKSSSIEECKLQDQKFLEKVSHQLEKDKIEDIVKEEKSSPEDEDSVQLRSSDSAFTFQSYDCSSRSSTLSTTSPSTNMSKSFSINKGFTLGELKLVDLEEEEKAAQFYASQEFQSSISGYESNADDSAEDAKSRMSFANPNYLSPEVQSQMEKKQEIRSNVLLRDDSHQSFAQALNSPADSLFSDYHEFHSRLNQDFVELDSLGNHKCTNNLGQGKTVNKRPLSSYESTTTESSISTVPIRKHTRPLSVEIGRDNKVAPEMDANPVRNPTSSVVKKLPSQSQSQQGRQLVLMMYIVGGREVGQVTVFRRPISIWKLDLTKTF